MGYFLPDPRWEQPALLNARKAPNGRYTIDYSNSLAKDLAAVYIPGQYYNPVTDTPYEIYSTSTFPAFSNGASEADGTSVLWSDLPGPPGSMEWTIYARVSASKQEREHYLELERIKARQSVAFIFILALIAFAILWPVSVVNRK